MKKLFYAFFFLLGTGLSAEADVEKKELNATTIEKAEPEVPKEEAKKMTSATRGDIKVIEASENIRYLSQKMVKDYLFFYKNQDKLEVKRGLDKSLDKLNDDFRIIATTTKDGDTKDILEFLAYSKDQIEEIFNAKADNESAALMLDYSETLLEGADSIANAHMYDFSREEKMLMLTKKIEYLLERVMKYYIAIHVDFNTPTNQEQMKKAINSIEEGFVEISLYEYPKEMKMIQKNLNDSWRANRLFFNKSDKLFIPKLMFISISHMEKMIDEIALYHSKNQ